MNETMASDVRSERPSREATGRTRHRHRAVRALAGVAVLALAVTASATADANRIGPARFLKVEGAADTLVLETTDKTFSAVVRLDGIRAPRSGEAWWAFCASQITRFLQGRRLWLEVTGDADGVVRGRVVTDRGNVDVASSLVRSGCARALPGAAPWLVAHERAARREGLRIWTNER
jgi:endonuclease YncB( thermonuclease family)